MHYTTLSVLHISIFFFLIIGMVNTIFSEIPQKCWYNAICLMCLQAAFLQNWTDTREGGGALTLVPPAESE